MCVTSLLGGPWADLWPFYGLYSKPCKPLNNWENRLQYNPWKGHKSTHGQRISCFLLKSFHFRRLRKLQGFFFHANPYISNVMQQCRCSPMLIFRAWATCGLSRDMDNSSIFRLSLVWSRPWFCSSFQPLHLFRSFWSFRLFRPFRFGGFVSLFPVLVHATKNKGLDSGMTSSLLCPKYERNKWLVDYESRCYATSKNKPRD